MRESVALYNTQSPNPCPWSKSKENLSRSCTRQKNFEFQSIGFGRGIRRDVGIKIHKLTFSRMSSRGLIERVVIPRLSQKWIPITRTCTEHAQSKLMSNELRGVARSWRCAPIRNKVRSLPRHYCASISGKRGNGIKITILIYRYRCTLNKDVTSSPSCVEALGE